MVYVFDRMREIRGISDAEERDRQLRHLEEKAGTYTFGSPNEPIGVNYKTAKSERGLSKEDYDKLEAFVKSSGGELDYIDLHIDGAGVKRVTAANPRQPLLVQINYPSAAETPEQRIREAAMTVTARGGRIAAYEDALSNQSVRDTIDYVTRELLNYTQPAPSVEKVSEPVVPTKPFNVGILNAKRRREIVEILRGMKDWNPEALKSGLRGFYDGGLLYDVGGIYPEKSSINPYYRLCLAIFGEEPPSEQEREAAYRALHQFLRETPDAPYSKARRFLRDWNRGTERARKATESVERSREIPTEVRRMIDDTLSTLTPEERAVVQYRFFDGKTLKEAEKNMKGVTKERARQIEYKALRKLRHPSRSRKLKPYFEDGVVLVDNPLILRSPDAETLQYLDQLKQLKDEEQQEEIPQIPRDAMQLSLFRWGTAKE